MFAYNLIAQVKVPSHKQRVNECKKWIQNLKKEKEDNFIMFTHQNPLMDGKGFNKIDFHSVELREVEKKEMINFIDS